MGQPRVTVWLVMLVVAGCTHRADRPFPIVAPPPVALPSVGGIEPSSFEEPAAPGGMAGIGHLAAPPNEPREGAMTLDQAVEMALRHSEIVRVTSGGMVSADDSTAFDVAAAESRVLAALAAFDASWATEFTTTNINEPPNAFFGPGLTQPTQRDEATYGLSVNKRWRTGAQTSVAFNPDPGYLFLPQGNGNSFNPTYTGELEFNIRQPLLRGAGLRVNNAPIRIRQIQTEQSAWEFKKAVMASARSVCEAYWDLYAARAALQAANDVIPLLEEIVRLQEENYRIEWVIKAEVAKAYAQLFDFRQRQLAARSAVLAAELRLRNLLRLPPEDGWVIVPVTDPGTLPVAIDPDLAATIATENQPDIVRQRLETQIREMELLIARNNLLPNFDVRALYQMNGVGEDVSATIRQMFGAEYSDWLVGFAFSVPLGNRQATANERVAELQLARSNGLLQQEWLGVAHRVRNDVRAIDFAFQEFTQAHLRRLASSDWLAGSRLRYENPRPGSEANWLVQSLNDYLYALRFHADATADAATVLARYNTAIVKLEETQGTLLEFLNIDFPTDPCYQAKSFPLFPGVRTEMPAMVGVDFDRAPASPPAMGVWQPPVGQAPVWHAPQPAVPRTPPFPPGVIDRPLVRETVPHEAASGGARPPSSFGTPSRIESSGNSPAGPGRGPSWLGAPSRLD